MLLFVARPPRVRRLWLSATTGALGAALGATMLVSAPDPASGAVIPSAQECLSRPDGQTTATGDAVREDGLREPSVSDDHTFDLRGTVFLGQQDTAQSPTNLKPINIGGDSGPSGLCLVGGHVKGVHSRDLGWEYLKHDPGGGDKPAVRIGGTNGTLIAGLRIDNMMNGVRPVHDGLTIRDSYFSYIRDDCLANDDLRTVRIVDSLFDGCYVAFSQRPGSGSVVDPDGPRDTSTLILDRVLVRMERMPGGFRVDDPEVETYGHIWKWSKVAGPAYIRDSIILAEDIGKDDVNDLDWPRNVTAENVTLVWTGEGSYPGRLPSTGVTVTRDVAIWDQARANWLERHGCTDVDHCRTERLVSPSSTSSDEPIPAANPSVDEVEPSPDTEPSKTTSDTPQDTTDTSEDTTATPDVSEEETTVGTPPSAAKTVPAAPVVDATSRRRGVRLTWNRVTDADRYKVFRATGEGFELIGKVSRSRQRFVDTEVKPGRRYTYRVAAVNRVDGTRSKKVSVTHRGRDRH